MRSVCPKCLSEDIERTSKRWSLAAVRAGILHLQPRWHWRCHACAHRWHTDVP